MNRLTNDRLWKAVATDSYIEAKDLKEMKKQPSMKDLYVKLGKLERLIDEMDSVRIIERDGITSLHINMILTSETLPIVKEIFKDKLKENKEE